MKRVNFLVLYLAGVLVWLIPGVTGLQAAASTDPELVRAYKKEFSYLQNEKKALESRLQTLQVEKARKREQAQNELDSLQGRLLRLIAEGDRLSETLGETEFSAGSVQENRDLLQATLLQAVTTLRNNGIEVPESRIQPPEEGSDALPHEWIYDQALQRLGESGSIRRAQGDFFLEDGSKTRGTIFRLGNIAAYGISEAGGGALAPAGEGRLKLWDAYSYPIAQSFAAKTPLDTLKIFLFESLDKSVEKEAGRTVIAVIQSGGVIAWVIVGLGMLALLMIVGRTLFLYKSGSKTENVTGRVAVLVEQQLLEEAEALCKERPGAASRVLAATVRNLHRDGQSLEDIVSESILHETPYLDRFSSAILVFAAVAPLLGLLGTVTGMISTFDIITEYGTGDPKLLSGGISEALVTTELGLIVAIPTLLLGTLLSGWAENIKSGMEQAALQVINASRRFGRSGRKSGNKRPALAEPM